MRWASAHFLLLGVATCATAAAAAEQAATVRIDVAPLDAHAYIRQAATGDTVRVCTGWCTIRIPAGTYRVEAGFLHAELFAAPEALVLGPADQRNVHVDIRRRDVERQLGFGLTLAGVAAIGAALPAYAVEGGFTSNEWRPVTAGLVIGGAVLAGTGLLLMARFGTEVHATTW